MTQSNQIIIIEPYPKDSLMVVNSHSALWDVAASFSILNAISIVNWYFIEFIQIIELHLFFKSMMFIGFLKTSTGMLTGLRKPSHICSISINTAVSPENEKLQ